MKKDFFVGADVSKDKLDICFLTSNETKKTSLCFTPKRLRNDKSIF